MEHLAIVEKIIDNISDSLEPKTAIYIFAAAIYDDWIADNSTQLENNLAKRLTQVWKEELIYQMIEAYRKTKYDEIRPEADEYYKKWIESHYKLYNDNQGLKYALREIWNDKYGLRIYWPL
jgi:hypothetical protein